MVMNAESIAVSFLVRVVFEYEYACKPFDLRSAIHLDSPQKLFEAVKTAYPPARALTLYGKRYLAPLLVLQETSLSSTTRNDSNSQPLSTKRFSICEFRQTNNYDKWHQRTVRGQRRVEGGSIVKVELHLRTLEAALRAEQEDWLNEGFLRHPEFTAGSDGHEGLKCKTCAWTEESELMKELEGEWPSPPWDLQMQDGGRAIRAENVVDFEVTDVEKLPGTWPWFPPRKYEEEWAKDMNQVRLGPQ
ncbi:hypothetical protein OHC33_001212 [Knufia fluminis]|uniref:Uncharacterized protein n=1 Tax=Knufia fluminis TaxID=191047 RepID=A0AAN8I7C4_9EURO|nr:hypothetical protein OHC33_001212 [Knufia fluminis]